MRWYTPHLPLPIERQPGGESVAVEGVDVVLDGVDPVLGPAPPLLRVDLDPEPLALRKARQKETARRAEVDDPLARGVAPALAQEPVHLRVAVLDVVEEPLVVAPLRRVREVEERRARPRCSPAT